MYNDFWGFRESPFGLSPDPAFLYESAQHQEALANLTYGVENKKGLIVLTGEVGTGKTMLLRCLQKSLEGRPVELACLLNPRVTVDQFFELIAYDLDLQCERTSKTEVLYALNEVLTEQANNGWTTALIVDEAQKLSWDVLEEIRLLGNLETLHGKSLQIVLAGQPEFDRKLDARNLRQLKQRIVLRCTLRAFTEAETREYIPSRLKQAGMPEPTVFPPDLLAEIHAQSHGIPRLINVICDNLLLTAFALQSKVATTEMLAEVIRDLHLGAGASATGRSRHFAERASHAALVRRNAAMARLGTARPRFSGKKRTDPEDQPQFRLAVTPWNEMPGAADQAAPESPVPIPEPESRLKVTVARTATKIRRATLVWLTALACVSLMAPFSKPVLRRLVVLTAAVSSSGHTGTALVVPANANAELRTDVYDAPPKPLRIDPVEYTPTARYAGFRGKVFVVVRVDPQGRVTGVEFTAPTAYDLDGPVRDIARRWRFKPALHEGETVEGRIVVQVPFK
jgi:general secretion pathway protein A